MRITIKNIGQYLQGHIREWLFYNCSFLLKSYIKEQIKVRLNSMNPTCFSEGSCVECGCSCPALQMANKACEGNCYPPIVSKKIWSLMKNNNNSFMVKNNEEIIFWRVESKTFKK